MEKLHSLFSERLKLHQEAFARLADARELQDTFAKVCSVVAQSIAAEGTIYFCGNGGSASDAEHAAAEFVGRFVKERRPLRSYALSTNTSTITAVGNDYGFEQIFVRQIEGLGKKGDVLFGISTSGQSKNVNLAMVTAKELGLRTVALVGENKQSVICQNAEFILNVPSRETAYIQEMHIFLIHALCAAVDQMI